MIHLPSEHPDASHSPGHHEMPLPLEPHSPISVSLEIVEDELPINPSRSKVRKKSLQQDTSQVGSRLKATLSALVISTLPVLGLGIWIYITLFPIELQPLTAGGEGRSRSAPVQVQPHLQTTLALGILLTTSISAILALIWANRWVRSPSMTVAVDNEAARSRRTLNLRNRIQGTHHTMPPTDTTHSVNGRPGPDLESLNANNIAERSAKMGIPLAEGLDAEQVLAAVVKEVRQSLQVSRVLFYQFDIQNPEAPGSVVAESVTLGCARALGLQALGSWCEGTYLEQYRQGYVDVVDDVSQLTLSPEDVDCLEQLSVKANLVVPVVHKQILWGLLIVQHCLGRRVWLPFEVDSLAQLANQLGVALEHLHPSQPLGHAHLEVERIALPLSELGNHSRLHLQMLSATTALTQSVQTGQTALQHLATNVGLQSTDLQESIGMVQGIANAIHQLIGTMHQAQLKAQSLQALVCAGDETVDQTITSITNLRRNLLTTTRSVKQLGDLSQRIADVIYPLQDVTRQSNALTMNAAIEAGRVGVNPQSRRLMSAIAESMRALAEHVGTATHEVESLVSDVRETTQGIISTMKTAAEQLTTSTQLTEVTQQQFEQTLTLSDQLTTLVDDVNQAIIQQAKTSAGVGQSIQSIVQLVHQSAHQSEMLEHLFETLNQITQTLHNSATQLGEPSDR
jgi:methyl-accepting chemotaxis protein